MELDEMTRCNGWALGRRGVKFHYFWGGRSICEEHPRPKLAHPIGPENVRHACRKCWRTLHGMLQGVVLMIGGPPLPAFQKPEEEE